MKKEKIAQQLSDILPDRPATIENAASSSNLVEKEATKVKAKQDAKEIARIRYIEKQKLKRMKAEEAKRESLAEELGIDLVPDGRTELQARRIAEQEKKVKEIEAVEAQVVEPLTPVGMAEITPSPIRGTRNGTYSGNITTALAMQGTTRPEIVKLLTQLNINLNIQLTKQDTANLLACLLTCNEAQLTALQNNKKVPVAIKIIIKRLIEDVKLGNIDTVDMLWDRIFGKGAMQMNLPETTQLQTGILPNVPISREAYVVIRDTLMK